MSSDSTKYTVVRGDTLWALSRRYNVSIDSIAQANDMHGRERHMLQIGQQLDIPSENSSFDTLLELRILDLAFRPITRPKLTLEFDGTTREVVGDELGRVGPIAIDDHARGLKVHFRHLDGRMVLIADHKELPLGRKRLTLTSRQMIVRGRYQPSEGTAVETKPVARQAVKSAYPDPHISVPASQKAPPPSAPAAKRVPKPVVRQTRVDGGTPQQTVGGVFTEGNLLLSPANEKYRKLLISIAQKHNLTPQALAALINAEASKLKSGEWNANAKAGSSSAAGLTQFLSQTWLEVATDKRSAVNQELKRQYGYEQINGRWVGKGKEASYHLFGKKGKSEKRIAQGTILPWRYTPYYSIDAAAVYGLINLDVLQKNGLKVSSLSAEDKAKLMYLAHHEGAGGAIKVLKGDLTEERAKELLPVQIGAADARAYAKRFGGNYVRAYTSWLYGYIDRKIVVSVYMVNPKGVSARTMAQISASLTGASPPPKPQPKAAAPGTAAPARARVPNDSAASSPSGGNYVNPMKTMVIRTAKLASAKSATFGMVRNGGTQAHQGVDLAADTGTPVYAVADGRVVAVSRQFQATKNFGASVLLSVDVDDLPAKQRRHYRGLYPDKNQIYFFYAHLSRIDVKASPKGGVFVEAGDLLGATGSSGNAKGMTTIAKGGHLHFEVRHKMTVVKGLDGRVNPLPFLLSYTMPD